LLSGAIEFPPTLIVRLESPPPGFSISREHPATGSAARGGEEAGRERLKGALAATTFALLTEEILSCPRAAGQGLNPSLFLNHIQAQPISVNTPER
jgi:hypothetical protein